MLSFKSNKLRKRTFIMSKLNLFAGLAFVIILIPANAGGQPSASDIIEKNISSGSVESRFSTPVSSKVLLENKIDPAAYILGPGDVLSIFTWGNFQGQYTLTVSPEGMLLIPEVGPIDVAGLSLNGADEKISRGILKRYRNVEILISLVDLREFKVYIGGAVKNPGAYPATAVSRVSEIIELAGGFMGDETSEQNYNPTTRMPRSSDGKASKRNIRVFKQNGENLRADVLRFEITGRTEFDPMLREGDRIFIPVRERDINLYGIFGAVKNPGFFEYSPDDSLADLLNLGHGLTLDADSAKVEIVRFRKDNTETYNLKLDLKTDNWNIPLHSDDRVYIKELRDYHEKHQVLLAGEFNYPGYYAITPDSTKFSEILKKAGGLTEIASIYEAEVTRVSAEEIIDTEFERLKKMQISDMSESEYEYFKIKSRSRPGRVAVDLVGLIAGDSTKDLILRNGDVINVPRKNTVINVLGEVANPGILPYQPGADYRYYIARAGGYSDRARKRGVSIIKGITGEWKKGKKGYVLEQGDTVWIPEKKKRNYPVIIKDTLIFIGNIATVYLVIQQATK